MNKKLLSTFILSCLCLSLIGCGKEEKIETPTIQKEVSINSWQDAYKDVIKNKELDKNLKYDLVYIDEDDTPELVIENKGLYISLYTYDKEQKCAVELIYHSAITSSEDAEYTYAKKQNIIKSTKDEYAGVIRHYIFQKIENNTLVSALPYSLSTWLTEDKNKNGLYDEDEQTSTFTKTYCYMDDGQITEVAEEIFFTSMPTTNKKLEGTLSKDKILKKIGE